MTQDEVRHMNVLLEDIRHKVQLVFEGHQVLNHKIETLEHKVAVLEHKIAVLEHKIDKLSQDVLDIKGILSRVIDITDDHDKWLKDHEIRLKAIESQSSSYYKNK